MNILKEVALPTITMQDIVDILAAAKWVDTATHELVFPSCLVENPIYNPYEIDVKGELLIGTHSRDKFVPIDEIADVDNLFGYDVRYDPNASALAVLPKQVEEPLPFE